MTYNGYLRDYVPIIVEMVEKGATNIEIAKRIFSLGAGMGYNTSPYQISQAMPYIIRKVCGTNIGHKPLDPKQAARWRGVLPLDKVAQQVAWERRHQALRVWEADCHIDEIVKKLGFTTRARAYQLINRAKADRANSRHSPAERYLSERHFWDIDWPTLSLELKRGLSKSLQIRRQSDREICKCPTCGRAHWRKEN